MTQNLGDMAINYVLINFNTQVQAVLTVEQTLANSFFRSQPSNSSWYPYLSIFTSLNMDTFHQFPVHEYSLLHAPFNLPLLPCMSIVVWFYWNQFHLNLASVACTTGHDRWISQPGARDTCLDYSCWRSEGKGGGQGGSHGVWNWWQWSSLNIFSRCS